MIDLAIKILGYYTILASMIVIAISILRVGETREYSRAEALINFVILAFVIIFAVLVLMKG